MGTFVIKRCRKQEVVEVCTAAITGVSATKSMCGVGCHRRARESVFTFSTVRLSKPQHFVAVVLHNFYECNLFESLLSQSQNSINDLYGAFVEYLKRQDIGLRFQLNELEALKNYFAKMRRELRQAYGRADFYIHDVSYTSYTTLKSKYTSSSLGRRIVVDPPDQKRFLDDGFYLMNSAECFAVQPIQSRHLEMHLFVTKDCPYDVKGLKKVIRADSELDGTDVFDNDWATLVVVYNLHTVLSINEWLSKAREYLEENVRQRRYIHRSPSKEDQAVRRLSQSNGWARRCD